MADPWWRFYCETISDRKFRYLSEETGLNNLEVLGAWAIICTIGHESPRYGALLVTSQKHYSNALLSRELNITEIITDKLLKSMIEKGMLTQEEDGTYIVTNLAKRQYKDALNAARVRKSREKKRENITKCITDTLPETETETDSLSEHPISKKYTELTGTLPHNLKRWTESCQTMVKQGVTLEEFEAAVKKMDDDQMTHNGPWSVEGTALWVHSQHGAGKPIYGKRNGNRPKLEY